MEASTILLGLAALGAAGAALVGGDRPANAATPAAGGAAPPAAGGASSTTTPAAPPASGTTPPPPNPYGPGGGVAPPPPPPPPPPSSTYTPPAGSSQPIGGTYTPPGGGASQPVAPGETAGASGAASSTQDTRYPRQDPRRLPSGITRAKILFSQGVLRGLGFQGLSQDGLWGPRTSDAVLAFQGAANRDHPSWGLTVDGVLGPASLAALGWYFQRTNIGDRTTWNNLGTGMDHASAVNIAAAALGAHGLQGLGDIGPARW